MASTLTFTSAVLGGLTIAAADMVYGSGEWNEEGWDSNNDTANGMHRIDRITKYGRGKVVVYGNKTAYAHQGTLPTLGYAISMASAGKSKTGDTGAIIRAVYSDENKNTTIDFLTNPVTE
jgi:hypothetical protein